MSNLLKRARSDIQIAKTLMSPAGNPTNDEMITDQAAYHIQQGIEKALKYQTEISGVPYKKIHNLMDKARKIATDRMIAEAQQLGADAIVCFRYSTSSIMQSAAEIMAYGTAVKFK